MDRVLRLLALFGVAIACLPVTHATALPFPVTSSADTPDEGTLRWAIEEANSRPGADSIPIEVAGMIELESALPPIANSISIVGPGAADLTIERKADAPPFRILTFSDILPSVVRDLTLSGGLAPLGAGISSEAESLTLIGVVISGNQAFSSGGWGAAALGGGIYSSGALTLRDSTVWGNLATAEKHDFFVDAMGGGIYADGPLTVERSTIVENGARALEGVEEINASGGGIQGQNLTLTSSTIASNFVESEGKASGANLVVSATNLIRNTVIADPEGANSCGKPLDSGGYNLDEDGSCEFDEGSDLNGVAAGLDPVLKDNGGPTPTHALLEGSIAIDRGNSFGASTDQRGLPRPADFPAISNKEGGDGSDIGAFELQVPPDAVTLPAVPILVGTEPADRTPPQTRIVSGPARVGYERKAKFRFASSEAQSSFKCKVDKKKWKKCRSPYKLKVRPGKHLFKVRAIDRFGNADPSPARFSWRVKPVG